MQTDDCWLCKLLAEFTEFPEDLCHSYDKSAQFLTLAKYSLKTPITVTDWTCVVPAS